MPDGIELAKAYVQIVPSAEGIQGKITEALGGEPAAAGDAAGVAAEPHAHACVCFVRQNREGDRSRNLILSRKLE